MKKSVLLGIIGLAAGMATSYGQGYLSLDNYSLGSNSPLTYGANVPANGVSGALGSGPLSTAWSVGLYFVGGTQSLTDPAGTGIPVSPLVLGTGPGSSIAIGAQNAGGSLGYYGSATAFNTGSTLNTTATLEIVAYPTSAGSYAAAGYRGHSAPFSLTTVTATSPTPVNAGDFGQAFSVAQVAAIPEPTTLALAGLGGLASLIALRRKQA
jgi:hypothetical protein